MGACESENLLDEPSTTETGSRSRRQSPKWGAAEQNVRMRDPLGQCRVINNKLKYHKGKTRMRQTTLAICVWKRTKPSRSSICRVL